MSNYFVLELIIFVMIGSINDVCYFVLEMFVMMGSTSDVLFLCLRCSLLYCILLLDKNYKQYLLRYIIFIYIR